MQDRMRAVHAGTDGTVHLLDLPPPFLWLYARLNLEATAIVTLSFVAITAFLIYRYGSRVVLRSARARLVRPGHEQDLVQIVENLCIGGRSAPPAHPRDRIGRAECVRHRSHPARRLPRGDSWSARVAGSARARRRDRSRALPHRQSRHRVQHDACGPGRHPQPSIEGAHSPAPLRGTKRRARRHGRW